MALGQRSLKMPWRPCTPQGSAKRFSWHKYTILRGLRSTPPKFGRDSTLRPNFSDAPNPCFAGVFASSRGKLQCKFGLTTKPMRNCSRLREAGAVLRRRHSARTGGEQKNETQGFRRQDGGFPSQYRRQDGGFPSQSGKLSTTFRDTSKESGKRENPPAPPLEKKRRGKKVTDGFSHGTVFRVRTRARRRAR